MRSHLHQRCIPSSVDSNLDQSSGDCKRVDDDGGRARSARALSVKSPQGKNFEHKRKKCKIADMSSVARFRGAKVFFEATNV